ncbi:predicted protein [Naegleria gruberi]|uniref:Predicted protein n=1 Tax=Naegleria gruberi TaxID=5762 RepID=D2VJN4_NAEGR|nr:uncharacterized protein NAEGRDRAFT_50095 [Naegleria gruberi]EFC43061.1 predicted protein [Naegleria gruberi]|eukprot:XP_002675805.1 predicted protein [Naegleria gruberi strain NEG-M]
MQHHQQQHQQFNLNLHQQPSSSTCQQTNSWTGQSERVTLPNVGSNLLFNSQNMFSNNNITQMMAQQSNHHATSSATSSSDVMRSNNQMENNFNPAFVSTKKKTPTLPTNTTNNTTDHFFNLTQVNTPFTMLNTGLLVHNSSESSSTFTASSKASNSCDKTSPSNIDSITAQSTNVDVVLMNNACIFCKLNHKKCDRVAYPGCSNCLRSQKQCVYAQARKRGPKTILNSNNSLTGVVEYQFVDDSSVITERKSKTISKRKESPPSVPIPVKRESRYINERAYLNNLRQIELDRKYFDNISLDVYKSLSYSMVPPSNRDELMYWLSVSITGKTDLESELEDKIDPREPLGNSKLAFLFLMHAISFFRIGNMGFAKIFFEKGRDHISKCFDQTNDSSVIYTYTLMAYYLLSAECKSPSKCSSATACSKAANSKCYLDCVARSKYFYSICTWYLKEREKDMDEHCSFIRQGLCVSELFYLSDVVESEIDAINKKIVNNLTFGDILDFDEYSKFVVEKHIACLNTAVSSPTFNQLRSSIMSHSGRPQLFSLEEPVQQIMTKLDMIVKVFSSMNSDRTYTFLVVCLGVKALILFKQHKYRISSSADITSAANEITKMLTTNNSSISTTTTLLNNNNNGSLSNNNNKNLLLEQQLQNLINSQQFTNTQNSPPHGLNSQLTNTLNLSSSVHQQFLSPSTQLNNPTATSSSMNRALSLENIIGNTPSSFKTNQSNNNNTVGGQSMMNTTNNQQDMLINLLFSQQQQQQNGGEYSSSNNNLIPSSTSNGQLNSRTMDSSSIVQNLMMGLQTPKAINQPNPSTNNNLLNNLDLNQLLQSTNQYFPSNNNNNNYNNMNNNNNMDNMTQLLLSDVNNYMKPNDNVSTVNMNNSNDEILQQIINTLQPTTVTTSNSSNMFNNNNQNPSLDVTNLNDNQMITSSSNGSLTEKPMDNNQDEHVPHPGSLELNQDPEKMYFPIACVNCRSRHKKKGRHNNQSNTKSAKASSSTTVVATTNNSNNSRYQPYPQTSKNNDVHLEFTDELKRILASQMGFSNNLDQHGINWTEMLSNTSQLPFFQNQIAEKLNIAAYRKKTIELYEGVISLGYSLVDINLIEQALFESESIDSNSNYSPEILSLLYSIHAVTCQALGHDQQGFLSFQKAKNCLANFFDSWSNILVATTYCHLSVYCASKGDSDTAKFYLNFVDFYFGNRHKIDFDRLEEYVIDSNDNSLRDLMTKHADDPNIKNIMQNLGINSTELLLRNTQSSPTRHIYERLPKEADFKLLKFRILCGITLDACGKDQYPVMLRIDPPFAIKSPETSNDLSLLGKVSPEGTFHLSDGLVKMDSSNFKRYSFSSYFCKILADMHLYITGRIPKHVLHMLTEVQPTLDNLSSYMEIIDNLSKIYREHEKRRKFNDLQLPLALCIFNLFVFGTKLFLVKEVYRKTKATQKNSSPNSTMTNKGVLHFLNSEILKLSNVVTKCTTIENFELLKPNLMNSVASAAEVHLELLEALSEISQLPFASIVETLELSNYFGSTFSAQDIQNPLAHKQVISQFEQQLLDMIDLDINALNTWKDRYGNDKYAYLIERMELFKQRRSNQLFESIQFQSHPNNLFNNSYNHEDNYSLNIPQEIQQNLQLPDIYKLANILKSEMEKNKLN